MCWLIDMEIELREQSNGTRSSEVNQKRFSPNGNGLRLRNAWRDQCNAKCNRTRIVLGHEKPIRWHHRSVFVVVFEVHHRGDASDLKATPHTLGGTHANACRCRDRIASEDIVGMAGCDGRTRSQITITRKEGDATAMKPTVTAKQIMSLIERQNFRCAMSGRPLTPETASLDHIVPLSRDGNHELSNLWVVDHQVNSAKGTLTVEEFRGLCQEIVNHRSNGDSTIQA